MGCKRIRHDYSDIEETEEIQQSKVLLASYNEFIENTNIRLEHQVSDQAVNLNSKISWRTFVHDCFDYGGRFYGGWWGNCKRENRRYISINNQPTVECDYTANHLFIYYSLNEKEIPEELRNDPYAISEEYPRDLIKLIITRLFNCDGRKGITNHFRMTQMTPEKEDKQSLSLIKRYLSCTEDVRRVLDVV